MGFHTWEVGGIRVTVIISCILIVFIFVLALPIIMNEAHRNDVPLCPEAGLKHYEREPGMLRPEFVAQQFQEHGWQNIQVLERPDGGIFGGTHSTVSGDCP